jgi:hypothetical protein
LHFDYCPQFQWNSRFCLWVLLSVQITLWLKTCFHNNSVNNIHTWSKLKPLGTYIWLGVCLLCP